MVKFTTKYRGKEVFVPSKMIDAAADKLSPKNLARLAVSAEFEMRKYLTRVSDALIARHSSPWSWNRRGGPNLMKRSGAGMRSVKNFLVQRRGEGVTGNMRLNKIMAIHEHGAVIRAKNTTYLTIPLEAALNSDGTPKKRSAREWRDTFVIKSKRGNLIICQRRGRRVIPLYVLKKRVRLPARLGLRKELSRQRPQFRRAMLDHIRDLAKTQRSKA